jgi:hypothetical protein
MASVMLPRRLHQQLLLPPLEVVPVAAVVDVKVATRVVSYSTHWQMHKTRQDKTIN